MPTSPSRVSHVTERHGSLSITLWSLADIAAMGEYWRRNRAHLTPTQPHRPDAFWTVDGQRTRVAQSIDAIADRRLFPFLIREDGGLVGEVVLSDVVAGVFRSCHLGYSVDAQRLRRGIAGWAVGAAVDIAFSDVGLHRVQAATLTDNVASQGVLTTNGFDRIGLAREYLAIAGEWRDHLLWQRVNSEMNPEG